MCRLSASEFPDPFYRVQLRAIGGHVLQHKPLPASFTPESMETRMVVFDVVDDQHNPATGMRTDLAQMLEKREERLSIKPAFLPAVSKLSVSQSNRSEITDAFAGRVVQHHRVFDFRRNPHATPRPVLFESDFVQGPQIDSSISPKAVQFFYIPPVPHHWRGLSLAGACASESRNAERVVGTASLQGRYPIAAR